MNKEKHNKVLKFPEHKLLRQILKGVMKMIKTAILTMSDKGSRGERIDGTGPALIE